MSNIQDMLQQEWIEISTRYQRRAQVYRALAFATALAATLVTALAEPSMLTAIAMIQPGGVLQWAMDLIDKLRDLVAWSADAIRLRDIILQFHTSFCASASRSSHVLIQASIYGQGGTFSFRVWHITAVDIHSQLSHRLTQATEEFRSTRSAYRILQPIMAWQQQMDDHTISDAELSE